MAYETPDGFKSTNRAPMMQHKRSMESKGMLDKMQPLAQPGEQDKGEGEDGTAIAKAHGPAHEIHISHHAEKNLHHVHSVHPDGHHHHSDHASKEEAHEHGKDLAAVGANEEAPEGNFEEEPSYE